jgi:hypothetical protein
MVETSRLPNFIDKELADVIENSVTGDYKEFTDFRPIVIIVGYCFFHQRNLYIVSPIHFIVLYTTCFGYLVAIFRCDIIQVIIVLESEGCKEVYNC